MREHAEAKHPKSDVFVSRGPPGRVARGRGGGSCACMVLHPCAAPQHLCVAAAHRAPPVRAAATPLLLAGSRVWLPSPRRRASPTSSPRADLLMS